MMHKVILLGRAERELREATAHIAQQAPETAERWFNSFIAALDTLAENPNRCGLAPESDLFPDEIRQFLYRTKSRYPTRALFTIVGEEVRILMIRRPGQALLREEDL
jgi:plasmid stabilization system protein ParE